MHLSGDVLNALAGKRIALTRPREQSGDFESIISSHGGIPILAPAIAIRDPDSFEDLDAALRTLKDFDLLIFTSVNAVNAVSRRAESTGVSLRSSFQGRIATVGSATAEIAAAVLHNPEVISEEGNAEALISEMGSAAGTRIFFPRGNLANPEPVRRLVEGGATVVAPVVYTTVTDPAVSQLAEEWERGDIDAVLFASPSAVHAVSSALMARPGVSQRTELPAVFCIGKMTASAARAANLPVAGIAASSNQTDLIRCAAQWFAHRETTND